MTSNKFLIGMWDHEEVFLHAAKHLTHDGVEIHETLTPFPVHGLEHALGYRETRLHTAGFLYGITGTTMALLLMGWIMSVNYPIVFGGKPFFALPSFIPITFELTVLFSAVGMVLTYCTRNKLFPGYVPRIYDPRTTDDRFAFVFDIEGKSEADVAKLRTICESNGAVEIKTKEFKEGEGL
ncbi:MAG: DUF3341 domain-containing protein [Chitinophagales bacterium]|nr:DUF3341 domain-containing protein [Chitinophagales bacterium]